MKNWVSPARKSRTKLVTVLGATPKRAATSAAAAPSTK
jgi:hypothetical protein